MAVDNLPWSKSELAELRRLRSQNTSNIEISAILKRTLSSVQAKVRHLRLPALKSVSPSQRKKLPPTPHVDSVHRAGKTTLPPLASLQDERC